MTTMPSASTTIRLPFAYVFLLATLTSIVFGALIAHGDLIVVAVIVLLSLALWLVVTRPGLSLGTVWIIALNGIPLIDLESNLGPLKSTDAAVIGVMIISGIQWLISTDTRQRTPMPRTLALACAAFTAWWLVTFIRSLIIGIPALDAFFYCRDFLFIVIAIFASWPLLSRARAWRECIFVVLIGVALYSCAYIGTAIGVLPTSFIHPHRLTEISTVTRLYTAMNDLIIAVAVFGLAVLITTRKTAATPYIVGLTTITFAAFLLQLTRAAYLGVALGAVIAMCVAVTRGPQVRRILVRRLSVGTIILAIVLSSLFSISSNSKSAAVIGERVTLGLTETSNSSGTFGYRLKVYSQMTQTLGNDWPIGLGFLHPKDRYFPDLPKGGIRNSDVGLLNAVMTMGLVGLALLYGILAAAGLNVVNTRQARPPWLVVGFLGWLAVLAVSSPTLVTLFSPTGLITTGLTLAVCTVNTPSLGILFAKIQ